MNNITVQLVKQTYKMDDGNLISGVQVIICPMVFKFISLNKQKLDLLSEIRPDFYQWFCNASDGQSLILTQSSVSSSSSISAIYSDQHPEL